MVDKSVHAPLNFLKDKIDGGIWCNEHPERSSQSLVAVPVQISEARSGSIHPRLDSEGFTLCQAPIAAADWYNPQWISETYIPACERLVAEVTGAPLVRCLRGSERYRMADPEKREQTKSSPPAPFAHLDATRESGTESVIAAVGNETLQKYDNYAMINVWRALTPAPQNTPLALCDQRGVLPDELVAGATEYEAKLYPYWASVYSPELDWYYFPDMTIDEVIVFRGLNSNGPWAGSLHSGFELPEPDPAAIPRESLEVRLVAFYDS